jgi:hypothetical protein
MLNATRMFSIDHPELLDQHPDSEFARFIEEAGGLPIVVPGFQTKQ